MKWSKVGSEVNRNEEEFIFGVRREKMQYLLKKEKGGGKWVGGNGEE